LDIILVVCFSERDKNMKIDCSCEDGEAKYQISISAIEGQILGSEKLCKDCLIEILHQLNKIGISLLSQEGVKSLSK
jgi:hypothetical protein